MNQPGSDPFLPLQGTRVLDLSRVLAGPLCTQYLGDLGADIVKIEAPKVGDDTRAWPPFEDGFGTIFLSVNRNKRSLALDLKSPEGLEIIRKLVQQSDVVIESFAPGVATRLGVGYEALSALNPRIVYCSLSGYGSKGPMAVGKGYDLTAQAFAGMLSITGEPGGPPVRSPFSPVDQGTGINAVVGILGGLMQCGRTGKGVKVEVSLFDTAVGFLGYLLQGYWQRGTEPQRPGSGHESLCPYQSFETRDKPLILGVANDALWRAFCDVADAPELASDPRLTTATGRVQHRKETVDAVAKIMLRKTRAEWTELLESRGIPCSPVHSFDDLNSHPHLEASDMILQYKDQRGHELNAVATPLRVNGQRPELRIVPPKLGQDTRSVLRDLGYADDDVARWIAKGVVAEASK